MIYIKKETEISAQAKEWIKRHKKELIEKFASSKITMSLKQLLQLSPTELKKALKPVISAANRDQMALVKRYEEKIEAKRSK